MRIYMQQHAPGEPLRFFQIQLQADLLGGWTLVRESGIQGQRGTVRQEYFPEREDAEHALMQLRDRQLRRGYRVVFREGSHLEGS